MNWTKRFFIALLFTSFLLALLTLSLGKEPSYAQGPPPPQLDVVFLIDDSYSSNSLDPGQWRWKAVHLFIDYLDALKTSNVDARIGYIIFAGDIITTSNTLLDIDGPSLHSELEKKQRYSDQNDKSKRYSDIKAAFEKASDFFIDDQSAKDRYPKSKYIILLSDGEACTKDYDSAKDVCLSESDELIDDYYATQLSPELSELEKDGIHLYVLNMAGWYQGGYMYYRGKVKAFWNRHTMRSLGEYVAVERSEDIFLSFQRLLQKNIDIQQRFVGMIDKTPYPVPLGDSHPRQVALTFLHSMAIYPTPTLTPTPAPPPSSSPTPTPTPSIFHVANSAAMSATGNILTAGYEIYSVTNPASLDFTVTSTVTESLPTLLWADMVPARWEACQEAVIRYEGATPMIGIRLLRDGAPLRTSNPLTGTLTAQKRNQISLPLHLHPTDGAGVYQSKLPRSLPEGVYYLIVGVEGERISDCVDIIDTILPTPIVGKIEYTPTIGSLSVRLPVTYPEGLKPSPLVSMILTRDGAPFSSQSGRPKDGAVTAQFSDLGPGAYKLAADVYEADALVVQKEVQFSIPGPTPTPTSTPLPVAVATVEGKPYSRRVSIELLFATPPAETPVIKVAETPLVLVKEDSDDHRYRGEATQAICCESHEVIGENTAIRDRTFVNSWVRMHIGWIVITILIVLVMLFILWRIDKNPSKESLDELFEALNSKQESAVTEVIGALFGNAVVQLTQDQLARAIADYLVEAYNKGGRQ